MVKRLSISARAQKMTALEHRFVEFERAELGDLRAHWITQVGMPAPRVSRNLLVLALGYELQAQTLGGLRPAVQRQLSADRGGATLKAAHQIALRPGTRLVREWNGVSHVVKVEEGGWLSLA